MSNLPSVERDRREPGPAEEFPQLVVVSRHLQRAATGRVSDRRHLLSAGQSPALLANNDASPSVAVQLLVQEQSALLSSKRMSCACTCL